MYNNNDIKVAANVLLIIVRYYVEDYWARVLYSITIVVAVDTRIS